MSRLGILLLAAGGSTRMGRPKALLPFGSNTLIQDRLSELGKIPSIHRMVALGAHFDTIRTYSQSPDWHIFQYPDWSLGMGTTISEGVKAQVANSNPTHILIALLDQPYLKADHFQSLIATGSQNPTKIIAAGYNKIAGAPALFPSSYFPSLLSLSGDMGARKIFIQHPSDVVTVPMPEAAVDWDSPSDI